MDERRLKEAAFVLWVRQGGSLRAFPAAWAVLHSLVAQNRPQSPQGVVGSAD